MEKLTVEERKQMMDEIDWAENRLNEEKNKGVLGSEIYKEQYRKIIARNIAKLSK